jgi:ABC-type uncharacterized transport system auxiliary subunit
MRISVLISDRCIQLFDYLPDLPGCVVTSHRKGKLVKKQAVIAVATLILAGCDTTNTIPYKVSTDNVIAIQSALRGKKVTLGNFNLAPAVSEQVGCRLAGDVVVAPGKTPHDYIKEAFKDELFAAQVYQPGAPVTIDGQIEEFGFSSVSPAHWLLKLHVRSNVSEGYTVEVNYDFDTSWTAYSACKNVADAFGPAVSQLIHEVVANPNFAELAK